MMGSGMDRDKHNLHLAPFSFVAEYASKKKKKKKKKRKKSHTLLDFSSP